MKHHCQVLKTLKKISTHRMTKTINKATRCHRAKMGKITSLLNVILKFINDQYLLDALRGSSKLLT
jgi:hypothetical protein